MTKLMVIGGFLGAGKTSSIVRIAKMLIEQGKKVGIITNDKGENLVDTNFIASEGMSVFEITKNCFCSNFDEFVGRLETLSKDEMPEVILAEPIGSSINLIATILKPVMDSYSKQFSLAPLSVLADPKRVRRFMRDEGLKLNIPNEINHLFEKQLAEADIILLNKCDTLSKEEIAALTSYLEGKFPASIDGSRSGSPPPGRGPSSTPRGSP